jgi:hypothetical protein
MAADEVDGLEQPGRGLADRPAAGQRRVDLRGHDVPGSSRWWRRAGLCHLEGLADDPMISGLATRAFHAVMGGTARRDR